MKVEVLAVGTELLMGQIANTNAQYISAKLPEVGVGVYYHSVVGDNPERLRASLKLALERADVVITTGGLGPTKDDLTKETIASELGLEMELDKPSYDALIEHFSGINRPMTENNVKQAYLPKGSTVLTNRNGTAPGCLIEQDGKVVIMLPGPPKEMKPMFNEWVIPYFMKKTGYLLVSKFIKIFGIGESAMETMIIDIIENQTNPTIAPYCKDGEVTLRVTAICSSEEEGRSILEPTITEIQKRLGTSVYSIENEELHEVAARLLLEQKKTIAFAESCTAGLAAATLASIPGVSACLDRGYVTYSNRAKVEELGVSEETLRKYGAVSSQTALEMADGARRAAGTDLAVSVTGIAGPDGGTEEKPVGTVFIAIADKDGSEFKQLKLWGNRDRIRNLSTLNIYDMIRRKIM